jgi:NADH dehydrogenase
MSQVIKIAILGAGYAGVAAARTLEKKYRSNSDVQILLIDALPFHTMRTILHEVAAGVIDEDMAKINLVEVFKDTGVQVIEDYIVEIDVENQVLLSKRDRYDYDYLIIGAGSNTKRLSIRGMDCCSHSIWNLKDAMSLGRALDKFMGDDVNITVVGAGFTGVEVAGELAGRWRQAKISLINSKSVFMPEYSLKTRRKAERQLEILGVSLINKARVSEVKHENLILEDGRLIHSDLIVWTAGTEDREVLDGLKLTKNIKGQLAVNAYLQSIDDQRIFVVGDNLMYEDEDGGPIPKMVEHARASGALAAENIYRAMAGKPAVKYRPKLHGSVVSMGGLYGIAHLKVAGINITIRGRLAAFIKHGIHSHYFYSLLGWPRAKAYLRQVFMV